MNNHGDAPSSSTSVHSHSSDGDDEHDDEHAKSYDWDGWRDDALSFGLEVQSPFAEYLLNGNKIVETRTYPLPSGLLGRRMHVLRSGKGRDRVSSVPDRTTLRRTSAITVPSSSSSSSSTTPPSPSSSSSSSLEKVGWITFLRSFRYETREMFDNDAKDHLVDSSISGYGWTEDMPMYGWIVGDVGRYSTKSDDDDYDDDEFYHVATRRDAGGGGWGERRRRRRRSRRAHHGGIRHARSCIASLTPLIIACVVVDGDGNENENENDHEEEEGDRRRTYAHYSPPTHNVVENGYSDGVADETTTMTTMHLDSINLLDYDVTCRLVNACRPDVIVHCAFRTSSGRIRDSRGGEYDDYANIDREGWRGLEGGEGRCNNSARKDGGPRMIYISTEYVFDGGFASGEYPPYVPCSKVNPLNDYGRSKLEGERIVREILKNDNTTSSTLGNKSARGRGIIVRISLLYGEDCVDLGESPALEIMANFLPSAADTQVDHWATRFPTSAEDVARILELMIDRILEGEFPYSAGGGHGTTKYDLMQLQARILNISKSDVDERIEKCDGSILQLKNAETEALGLDVPFEFVSLESGMKKALDGFPERFAKG
ncbi:hypothetical protein ACHAXA_005964 [Cyclostephanos tholiformis]|uniref:RmlD-like substrate binding domain-containing protein n=1 Tax=Cyclostephanos tholiformis TaxID=382380 RepID=A0ABD3SE32_9STRA